MEEIDTQHFKVICQTCGKTGETDFNKPQRETGWALRFGYQEMPLEYEYHQCMDCADKENEEESLERICSSDEGIPVERIERALDGE